MQFVFYLQGNQISSRFFQDIKLSLLIMTIRQTRREKSFMKQLKLVVKLSLFPTKFFFSSCLIFMKFTTIAFKFIQTSTFLSIRVVSKTTCRSLQVLISTSQRLTVKKDKSLLSHFTYWKLFLFFSSQIYQAFCSSNILTNFKHSSYQRQSLLDLIMKVQL